MTTTTRAKSATRDGVTLRYIDTGAGDPPLLFIHGWTCNRTHWPDQVTYFAKKHRVVAVDLRGHGESDKPDQDYTIGGFVDDVSWLIGKLGLERPVVVGHSMGGTIALNLVRKHPDLTRAIVMIDSPICPLPEDIRPQVAELFAGLQTPTYAAVADDFVRALMFDENTPAGLADGIVGNMGAPQRVTLTALVSTLAAEYQKPGTIPVPALFIRAATPLATEDDLRERYPGLGVITVPCAHFVQMEQPAATNNIISDFLDKLE